MGDVRGVCYSTWATCFPIFPQHLQAYLDIERMTATNFRVFQQQSKKDNNVERFGLRGLGDGFCLNPMCSMISAELQIVIRKHAINIL